MSDRNRIRKAGRGWINAAGDEYLSSHVAWHFEREVYGKVDYDYSNGEVMIRSCYGRGAELSIDPDEEGLAKLDRVLELLVAARADLLEVMDAELEPAEPGGEE